MSKSGTNSKKPNILLILNDDMGYSDLGCYGGEVNTPTLNNLAEKGLRFTQFYNTPRCSPSRASLLTGLHPHQCGIGILTHHFGDGDYDGNIGTNCVTMAEVLKANGYGCYMSGKWHLSAESKIREPNGSWPVQRGFDKHYGIIHGAASYYWPKTLVRDLVNIEHEAENDPEYYFTDAVSDNAVKFIEDHVNDNPEKPFFEYVAYTAPHWPLHAKEEDIAKYKGRFDAGWDVLREERLKRMINMGLIDPEWKLTRRDPGVPEWKSLSEKEQAWQARKMEVYAAQIECMDRGIGRIVECLKKNRQLDNTIIMFMADNGGCAEVIGEAMTQTERPSARCKTRDGRPVIAGPNQDIMAGPEDTYQCYGPEWANLSNTPFRLYKHWTHEGGISTPFIVHWPEGIDAQGEMRDQHCYLPDVMKTVLDATGAEYPDSYNGNTIDPAEGESMIPAFAGESMPERMMFWEHEGNAAVRKGKWKLVKNFNASLCGNNPYWGDERGDWELYDSEIDRTEMCNLVTKYPKLVQEMQSAWNEWAIRCKVIDREKWLRASHDHQ